MFSIENPSMLLWALLILIPIIIFWFYARWSKSKIALLGNEKNVNSQLKGFNLRSEKIRIILLTILLLSSVVALINIRKGSGKELADKKGLDIIVALDVSKSMLATDEMPNRLEKSKILIQQTLRKLNNDRVGLVVFAGKAYTQSPLTSDYNAIKMLLESTSPDLIPSQGTVLGDAINLSKESFNKETNKYKVLLLISDGEDHDAEAIKVAKDANQEGVVIYTVGVGSTEGTTLIDPNTQQPKKDINGEDVISKLNEQILKDIASEAKGKYYNLKNVNKVSDELVSSINGLEKRNQGTVIFTQYKSYFQIFVIIAILCIVIDLLLGIFKK